MKKKQLYIAPLTEFTHVMYEGMIAATFTQDDWGEGKEHFFEEDEDGLGQGSKNLWDD